MKKLLLGAISFLVLFSACKDDDNVNSNTTARTAACSHRNFPAEKPVGFMESSAVSFSI